MNLGEISSNSEAFLVEMPCVVKSVTNDLNAKERIVSVEASCESMDSEGDIILQKALLDSASEFVANGDLDIDHISKIGHRYGISHPESYIIGRPLSVRNIGDGRTEVTGQIFSSDSFNPSINKFDEFWKALITEPQKTWRASIYGFPTDMEKGVGGAQRFFIRGMKWTSLAFTRHPVNKAIKGCTRIVTAKSRGIELAKGGFVSSLGETIVQKDLPSIDVIYKSYLSHRIEKCECLKNHRTLYHIRSHMLKCEGFSDVQADVAAHAVMYLIMRDQKRL